MTFTSSAPAGSAADSTPYQTTESLRFQVLAGDEAALERLRQRCLADRSDFESLHLACEAALSREDTAWALDCIERAERAWPGQIPPALLRAVAAEASGDTDAAMRIATEAVVLTAGAPESAWRLMSLLRTLGGRRALREALLRPDTVDRLAWPQLFTALKLLRSSGTPELLERIRTRCLEVRPQAAARIAAVLDEAHDVTVDWDADFVHVPREGSDTAIVVFAGLGQETGLDMEDLHALLLPLRAHFIAMRDPGRAMFLGPLPGLGTSLEANADALKMRLAVLGIRRTILLGNSAGSLGALAFGALMRAQAVTCFGAVTAVGQPFEVRAKAMMRRMQRAGLPWEIDVRKLLAERTPPVPVTLCFGSGMRIDAMHARYLEGVPGVSLVPIEGFEGHGAMKAMVARGLFLDHMHRVLDRATPVY